MFKFIKRILIFFIAAFTALILFACVAAIVDPPTEEEQKAAEQQMQEIEEQNEKEEAKLEAELKKKEQEEREKELEEALKDNAVQERRTNKLVENVEPLIPSIYKEKSTFDVYAATPTDKSIKGLFLNIQPVNSNFTDEAFCRAAAVEMLENIKNVKDINKITFNFVDAYTIKYKLTIEDWEAYKEKGINENTLELTKAD